MKRGPVPLTPAEKLSRGTVNVTRDRKKFIVTEPGTSPQKPDNLTEAGEAVWLDILPVITNNRLASEGDELTLSNLCNLQGAINSVFAAGGVPPAAFLSEARKLAEIYGLCGARSRVDVPPNPNKTAAGIYTKPVIVRPT
ncbi:MAG: hypothetical protein ACRYG8_14340 [Janthinobacterium lividum]